MSKLASGVYASFIKARDTLKKLLESMTTFKRSWQSLDQEKNKHFKFNQNILQYVSANAFLYEALSFKFNAMHLYNEG